MWPMELLDIFLGGLTITYAAIFDGSTVTPKNEFLRGRCKLRKTSNREIFVICVWVAADFLISLMLW